MTAPLVSSTEIVAAFKEFRRIVDSLLATTPVVGGGAGTPTPVDYEHATALTDTPPPGGWLTDAQVRNAHQRMVEAISNEKFVEGLVAMAQFCALVGAV